MDMTYKPQKFSEIAERMNNIIEIEKQKELSEAVMPDIADNIINKEVFCNNCGTKKLFNEAKYRKYPNFELIYFEDDCNCAEVKKEKEQQEQIAKDNRILKKRKIKQSLKNNGFSRKLRGFRLNRIDCEHIDEAKAYVASFKPLKSKGLLFIGSTGNGKTTLASCIGKEIVLKGGKVLIMTFNDFLGAMQKAEFAKDYRDKEWLLGEWAKYDLLIIDDFGREKYTDNRLVNTFTFFDRLVNDCTSFIITANPESIVRIKDLPEFSAIFDRIAGDCVKYIFNGESFRRK